MCWGRKDNWVQFNAVIFLCSSGSLTGLPADSPPNVPAKKEAGHGSSVDARRHKLDTTAGNPRQSPGDEGVGSGALGSGRGAAVGGVCSSLEDDSVQKTAQLVATCTAAATAAVLKATHLQVQYGLMSGTSSEAFPIPTAPPPYLHTSTKEKSTGLFCLLVLWVVFMLDRVASMA